MQPETSNLTRSQPLGRHLFDVGSVDDVLAADSDAGLEADDDEPDDELEGSDDELEGSDDELEESDRRYVEGSDGELEGSDGELEGSDDELDEPDDELEEDEPDDELEELVSFGSANATAGVFATAAPTPSANANAPARTMYCAFTGIALRGQSARAPAERPPEPA